MIKPDRMRERMNAEGLNQSQLAKRVGISQTAIGKLVTGESASSRHLHLIARELGTTAEYLTGGTNNPLEGAPLAPTPDIMAEQLELVAVEEIDQDYGMGGTFTASHIEVQIHYFPKVWIESITTSDPSFLTIARGRGDSMDPTIRDRDMVIIDRSRRKLDEMDAIWALTVGEIGMIKRLRLRGSTIVIKSDNQHVDDEIVNVDEVHLVGRVVFIGRRT